MQDNRTESAYSILLKTEKKKVRKQRLISSSKGNTNGLYKFIFHITID